MNKNLAFTDYMVFIIYFVIVAGYGYSIYLKRKKNEQPVDGLAGAQRVDGENDGHQNMQTDSYKGHGRSSKESHFASDPRITRISVPVMVLNHDWPRSQT